MMVIVKLANDEEIVGDLESLTLRKKVVAVERDDLYSDEDEDSSSSSEESSSSESISEEDFDDDDPIEETSTSSASSVPPQTRQNVRISYHVYWHNGNNGFTISRDEYERLKSIAKIMNREAIRGIEESIAQEQVKEELRKHASSILRMELEP